MTVFVPSGGCGRVSAISVAVTPAPMCSLSDGLFLVGFFLVHGLPPLAGDFFPVPNIVWRVTMPIADEGCEWVDVEEDNVGKDLQKRVSVVRSCNDQSGAGYGRRSADSARIVR